MRNLQHLEDQVKQLSSEELARFRQWFLEWDSDEWGRQVEWDACAGKLDALAAEALAEYQSGEAREI
jgi:hypothetical protein